VRYIRARPAKADFDLAKLPLDDRPSYELLTKAKTVAVFQLKAAACRAC
jgi:DNA polymerase-3 subunit alpha